MASMSENPSLENLIEDDDLSLRVMHPGGLRITKKLAMLCRAEPGKKLLDVACGTGMGSIYLAENFGCEVTGIDVSHSKIKIARKLAEDRGVDVEFMVGDAHNLPFRDESFDIVISECTLCLLDRERAIEEMIRVTGRNGYAGMHDICWLDNPPDEFRSHLERVEGEKPETMEGWREMFRSRGLVELKALDRSHLIKEWKKDIMRELGVKGKMRLFFRIMRKWGISGFRDIRKSEKIFESGYVGYCIVAGRKP